MFLISVFNEKYFHFKCMYTSNSVWTSFKLSIHVHCLCVLIVCMLTVSDSHCRICFSGEGVVVHTCILFKAK